jgi:hypothetical protein
MYTCEPCSSSDTETDDTSATEQSGDSGNTNSEDDDRWSGRLLRRRRRTHRYRRYRSNLQWQLPSNREHQQQYKATTPLPTPPAHIEMYVWNSGLHRDSPDRETKLKLDDEDEFGLIHDIDYEYGGSISDADDDTDDELELKTDDQLDIEESINLPQHDLGINDQRAAYHDALQLTFSGLEDIVDEDKWHDEWVSRFRFIQLNVVQTCCLFPQLCTGP